MSPGDADGRPGQGGRSSEVVGGTDLIVHPGPDAVGIDTLSPNLLAILDRLTAPDVAGLLGELRRLVNELGGFSAPLDEYGQDPLDDLRQTMSDVLDDLDAACGGAS